jgi:hypothetical protein
MSSVNSGVQRVIISERLALDVAGTSAGEFLNAYDTNGDGILDASDFILDPSDFSTKFQLASLYIDAERQAGFFRNKPDIVWSILDMDDVRERAADFDELVASADRVEEKDGRRNLVFDSGTWQGMITRRFGKDAIDYVGYLSKTMDAMNSWLLAEFSPIQDRDWYVMNFPAKGNLPPGYYGALWDTLKIATEMLFQKVQSTALVCSDCTQDMPIGYIFWGISGVMVTNFTVPEKERQDCTCNGAKEHGVFIMPAMKCGCKS